MQPGTKLIRAVVQAHFKPARLDDVRRAANAIVERTPLVWAGHVDCGDSTRLHWQTATSPAAIVVLRPDADHVRMIAIDAGASSHPRLPLIPGEPVLAWSDGSATAPKNAEVARLANVPNRADLASLVPSWYPRDPVK